MATTSSTPSSSSSDHFTPTEWTQQNMLSDMIQQKGVLIGVGIAVVLAFLIVGRRPAPQERAARRLVRDLRKVDDAADARDLLGENLPTIVRPAMLMALHEIERLVHAGFESLERDIERL